MMTAHPLYEMRGKVSAKYCPIDDTSPTHTLKQAMKKVAAVRAVPATPKCKDAESEMTSAPFAAEWDTVPMRAPR